MHFLFAAAPIELKLTSYNEQKRRSPVSVRSWRVRSTYWSARRLTMRKRWLAEKPRRRESQLPRQLDLVRDSEMDVDSRKTNPGESGLQSDKPFADPQAVVAIAVMGNVMAWTRKSGLAVCSGRDAVSPPLARRVVPARSACRYSIH